MALDTATELASFHEFVAQQLAAGGTISPEAALALWRAREETLTAAHEGLRAVEAGRTKSLKQFANEFRARHGISGGT